MKIIKINMYHEYFFSLHDPITNKTTHLHLYFKNKIDENNMNEEFEIIKQQTQEEYGNISDQAYLSGISYIGMIDITTKICEEDEYLPEMEKICSVCLKEVELTLFLPCLHQVVCRNCCIHLKDNAKEFHFKCPICRQKVKNVKQFRTKNN